LLTWRPRAPTIRLHASPPIAHALEARISE
jgi:hypothetical protein